MTIESVPNMKAEADIVSDEKATHTGNSVVTDTRAMPARKTGRPRGGMRARILAVL